MISPLLNWLSDIFKELKKKVFFFKLSDSSKAIISNLRGNLCPVLKKKSYAILGFALKVGRI
tara:strand:+ start:624 stop:809 length:186 start_codon:yes stop_codon:yes gene_type:complete